MDKLFFTIGGIHGLLNIHQKDNLSFGQIIKLNNTRHLPEFVIDILNTQEKTFRLHIANRFRGKFFVSNSQNLPFYGIMTILKVLMQMFLFPYHIILIHGFSDPSGNLYIVETDSKAIPSIPSKIDIIHRLIILRKENNGYYLYNDFLKNGNLNKKTSVKSLTFSVYKGIKKHYSKHMMEEFLFKSTWFYLFFKHFFGFQRINFLPTESGRRLKSDCIDLLRSINYNIVIHYV